MQEPKISKDALEKWAEFLIEHSLGGVARDDLVMIKGERICWPLMEILERRVIEAGGRPDVNLVPPNNERGRVWSSAMGRYGKGDAVTRTPQWHDHRYEEMTKYIEVLGAESPDAYAGLSAAQIRGLAGADAPFSARRLKKRWALTLYPTPAFARMEEMPLDEYVDFIVGASTTDPRPLLAAEEALAPYFQSARTMRITTFCPHHGGELALTLNLEPSIPALSHGIHNFPDGEIFTSPDARSTSGAIFIDLPVHYGGVDIQGIYLRFEEGRIVEYSAEKGASQLEAIIETDDGSHRLGEVALGMNPGLDRVLKHPLFVEKVGGTLHIAIGASYDQCMVDDPGSEGDKTRLEELKKAGTFNVSAQHVDIVADFRPGGCGRRVFLDDTELVVENRLWKVKR